MEGPLQWTCEIFCLETLTIGLLRYRQANLIMVGTDVQSKRKVGETGASLTNTYKQDYLKDLSKRHPEIVQLEQVFVLCKKHQIVLILKSIIKNPQIILLILTKLGLSHEGRAIWLVKIGKKGAPETTPRCLSAS